MSVRRPLKKAERKTESINRFGGAPIGVGVDEWATIRNPSTGESQPMIHVLTVATSDLDVEVGDDIAALALFASSAEMPLYFDDPTCDYRVVQLTKRAVERGELEGPELPEPELEPRGLEIGTGTADSLTYVGGEPETIQEPLPANGFVLQMDSYFSGLNLGDSGGLYMFTDWAMWDCH